MSLESSYEEVLQERDALLALLERVVMDPDGLVWPESHASPLLSEIEEVLRGYGRLGRGASDSPSAPGAPLPGGFNIGDL